MDHRRNPDDDRAAQARALLAAAANAVNQLEAAAGEAVCRLAALAGILARIDKLVGSDEPYAAEAAALDTAMLCREAKALLRSLGRSGKRPAVKKMVAWPAAARPPAH